MRITNKIIKKMEAVIVFKQKEWVFRNRGERKIYLLQTSLSIYEGSVPTVLSSPNIDIKICAY
jgi:hypothetical protein